MEGLPGDAPCHLRRMRAAQAAAVIDFLPYFAVFSGETCPAQSGVTIKWSDQHGCAINQPLDVAVV